MGMGMGMGMLTCLSIFVDAILERAAEVGLALEANDLDRVNREVMVRLRKVLERDQPRGTCSDNCDLH